MLVARNLHRDRFGPFEFDLPSGSCCFVTGRSGAGKSVLLRMLADLDPNSGSVSLDGVDRTAMTGPQWRRRVRYLSAESGWWSDTVGAHFAQSNSTSSMRHLLRLPEDVFQWPVSRLSTGERQKLSLLRGLEDSPRVLLLDEPSSGLDQESTQGLEAVLRLVLADGKILVVVSHSADQVRRLATNVVHIADGKSTVN